MPLHRRRRRIVVYRYELGAFTCPNPDLWLVDVVLCTWMACPCSIHQKQRDTPSFTGGSATHLNRNLADAVRFGALLACPLARTVNASPQPVSGITLPSCVSGVFVPRPCSANINGWLITPYED